MRAEAVRKRKAADGAAHHEHLRAAAARGNPRAIAALRELEGPERPEPLEYLWEWFCELDATRGIGMNGPNGITYTDIDAWARLTGRAPTSDEVRALIRLDLATRFPEVEV